MKKYLLPENGKFFKAAMHVHTNISDGRATVEEMKRAYMEKGYEIVAFTDHEVFVPHNDVNEENFLALNGVEISVNNQNALADAGGWPYIQTYHLNLYAKSDDIDYSSVCTDDSIYCPHSHAFMTERMMKNNFKKEYTTECINKLISASVNDGFLVSLNHPFGSMQNYVDYCGLKGLWGVEVYNHGSKVDCMPETIIPFEDLLHLGERVMPLAGDDSHDTESICCFTMIKADALRYDSVMKALENGDFYSSSGPEFTELYIEDGVLHVGCKKTWRIEVTTDRRECFKKQGENYSEIDGAVFDLNGYVERSHLTDETYKNSYFRVTAIDEHGNTAYTRAYFLTEIF